MGITLVKMSVFIEILDFPYHLSFNGLTYKPQKKIPAINSFLKQMKIKYIF